MMPDLNFDWLGAFQSTGLAGVIALILLWLARVAVVGLRNLVAFMRPYVVGFFEQHGELVTELKSTTKLQTETLAVANETLTAISENCDQKKHALMHAADAIDELADDARRPRVKIHTDQMRRRLEGK